MKEGTRSWIVRPRIGLGGISGLGTLLSGVFIEFDPGDGEAAHDFVGSRRRLDHLAAPGTQFVLRTDRLGSIGRGAPVYYRNLAVGQVLGYEPAEDKRNLIVNIDAPNDQPGAADSRSGTQAASA